MFRILFGRYRLRKEQKIAFVSFFLLFVLTLGFAFEVLNYGTFESRPAEFLGRMNHEVGDLVSVDMSTISVLELEIGSGLWLLFAGEAQTEGVLAAVPAGNEKFEEFALQANSPRIEFVAKVREWDDFNSQVQSRLLDLQSALDDSGFNTALNPDVFLINPYYFNQGLFIFLIVLGIALIAVCGWVFFRGGFEERAKS